MSIIYNGSYSEKSTMGDEDDRVYYNLRIPPNHNQNFTPISFSENRPTEILNNPSLYEASIVRFKVPATNIPIFLWDDDLLGKLKVTMSYSGTDITKDVLPIPNGLTTAPYGVQAEYQEQSFIDEVNQALQECFDDMKIAFPASPPTTAPQITYNNITGMCDLIADTKYDPIVTAPVDTIELYFNNQLFLGFFPTYQVRGNQPAGDWNNNTIAKAFQVLIKNNLNNTITVAGDDFYEMKQSSSTTFLWSQFESLVFQTNQIPTASELQNSNSTSSGNQQLQVLTDFEILDGMNNRTAIQYSPNGPLRYYVLKSKYPLRSIDITVYWRNSNTGNLYPVYASSDEITSMKILFRKRSAINSD